MASVIVKKGVHGANALCTLTRSAEHLVIFFVGDRITELSISTEIVQLQDPVNICNILAKKYGEISQKSTIVVISPTRFQASTAAVYETFLPELTPTGEPLRYNGPCFRASDQLLSLLEQDTMFRLLDLTPKAATATQAAATAITTTLPAIDVIGFSKGGIVLNQLLAEVAAFSSTAQDSATTTPRSAPLLRSLRHFHYLDVGLNRPGGYLADPEVFSQLSTWCSTGGGNTKLRIILHGTP
ncbi:hypothetical protein Ndes2526B_g01192 [Nannochloris sp. 'desiccata']|nr:hypothetical protein KSW81_004465 [Chlorella desiccata (nom. nud.)]KAH7623942.1 hypothetical protein NADE_008755 [Chlorella desiccata (nom. nud.)]